MKYSENLAAYAYALKYDNPSMTALREEIKCMAGADRSKTVPYYFLINDKGNINEDSN